MANYQGIFNYPQQYNNPMLQTQQRLNYLEQQYPQFSPQPILKGRPVSSFDEAKAAMIDLDGTPHYFIDNANGAIYIKQINLDGTASLTIYKRVEEKEEPKQSMAVTKEEFEAKVSNLQSQINQLSEVMENDKSNANVQRKRQPIRSDAESSSV